jgi:hypothetical protein
MLFMPFLALFYHIYVILTLVLTLLTLRLTVQVLGSVEDGDHFGDTIESIFNKIKRKISDSQPLPHMLSRNRYLHIYADRIDHHQLTFS